MIPNQNANGLDTKSGYWLGERIVYAIPASVQSYVLHNRTLLSTFEGGRVAVDTTLLSLWRHADGELLSDILSEFHPQGVTSDEVRAALTCLAEAGLLVREGAKAEQRSRQTADGGLVSVVIVGYNSREWLEQCLPSIFSQTWSNIEIIVVDNASSDDTVQRLQAQYSSLRWVCLEKKESFARAINEGAAVARGEYLLFLNPDVRLEPDAVAQMVAVAQQDSPSVAAVSAKLKFWWAPAFLNGIGNRVGAFSWGTDNALGHLDLGQFDSWREVPSACFAAALIPRRAWETLGPLDERFPMYYEDSEWSYRARLLGYSIRAAPQSVVYHAFGGRVPSGETTGLAPHKLRNVVYGRLRFAFKIVGGKAVRRFLRNYLMEDLANWSRALLHRDVRAVQAYISAWLDTCKGLPLLLRERRALQAGRVRSDEELFGVQRQMSAPLIWHGLPELTWDLVRSYYLPLLRSGETRPMPEFNSPNRRSHLLIVSHDVVDTKMAGPGMRYLEMARALSSQLEVTLAVPSDTMLQIPNISLIRYWEERPASLQVLVENSDVALISGYMVEKFPFLQNTRTRLVVDLYDPFVLENLHYYLTEPISHQETLNRQAVDITNRLARLGDFFICGNERQRDFYMGVLAANGRVNPLTFTGDPSLNALVAVVGIGFPNREPHQRRMLRGIHPAFPAESRIVLWGGGIWDWLDPLTLVRAWPQVLAQHPEARLVFLGTRHPNPLVPRHQVSERTEALAAESGEKDRTIFFYEWLPYEEREGLLCEADIGVTLHPLHIETRYSIRTRVLDYLWARLPVLVSDGDVTSEWVREYRVGRVVPPSDVDAVAQALGEMLDKPKVTWAAAFEPLRDVFSWDRAVEPLARYCQEGGYAPDRKTRGAAAPEPVPVVSLREQIEHVRFLWRTEGFRVMAHRVWRYIQWRLASL